MSIMERGGRQSRLPGSLHGRGVLLTIMAVPLFLTVYFLIFLDLDINEQSRTGGAGAGAAGAGANSRAGRGVGAGRNLIKTIVKMQRAMDDLGRDLSRVVSHREYIRLRVTMYLSDTSAQDVKRDEPIPGRKENHRKGAERITREELQELLGQHHFGNYTSGVKRELLATCSQVEAFQSLAPPVWRDTFSYTEDGLYGLQPVRTIRARTDMKVCSLDTAAHANTKETGAGSSQWRLNREESQGSSLEGARFCRLQANHQILREVFMFQQLWHPSISTLVGFCVRDMHSAVSYIVEGGRPTNITEMKSLPWKQQLRMLWGLSDLMEYLLLSPLGAVYLPSMTPKSFHLTTDSQLQLWDIGSLLVGDKQCTVPQHCFVNGTDYDVRCIDGRCIGHAHMTAMHIVREQFFEPLIQQTPAEVSQSVTNLLRSMHSPHTAWSFIKQSLEKWGAPVFRQPRPPSSPPAQPPLANVPLDPTANQEEWLRKDQVWHTGQDMYSYKRLTDTDLPGRHEYACPRSQVTWGCVVSMPSEDAAFRRCSGDPQCRAFVVLTNTSASGWINVCFKNGYVDIVNSQDTTLYIKVPLRSIEDDLRVNNGHESDQEVDVESEVLQACAESVVKDQQRTRLVREKRLMSVLDREDLSESSWLQSVSSGIITSTGVAESAADVGQMSGSIGGGASVTLRLRTAMVPSVRLMVQEGPTYYHHAHLLFYHVDRLLGVYLTPPTKQHVFAKDELSFLMDHMSNFKDKFAPLVRQESLTGVLTVVPPRGVVGVGGLSLAPLANLTHELRMLNGRQRNHLEYVLLLWLTGTPRMVANMLTTKGVLLHLDATDAFQQGVDTLLPYLYHCQFPRHVIELLLTLERDRTSTPSCSLGSQVLFSLQEAGVSLRDLQLHFKNIQQVALLLNRAAQKLLEIVKLCSAKFGEESVLYE